MTVIFYRLKMSKEDRSKSGRVPPMGALDTAPDMQAGGWRGADRRGRMTSPLGVVTEVEGLGSAVLTPADIARGVTTKDIIAILAQSYLHGGSPVDEGNREMTLANLPAAWRTLEQLGDSPTDPMAMAAIAVREAFMVILDELLASQEREATGREIIKKLMVEMRALHLKAYKDTLTGLPGRRALDEFTAKLFEVYKEFEGVFSVLFIDVDNFKDLNTKHGHDRADEALRRLGKIIPGALRQDEDACFENHTEGLRVPLPSRAGGDEFIVILPDTGLHGGGVAGERIRRAVEGAFRDTGVDVTVSIGVAEVDYERHRDLDDIRRDANAALDVCKKHGRNGVYTCSNGSDIIRVTPQDVRRRESSSRDKTARPLFRVRLLNLVYRLKRALGVKPRELE